MKITFQSDNDVFKPQIFMDEEEFRESRGVFPITQEIYRAEGDNTFLLTGLTDFNVLPSKVLLRTDLPQYDGAIHYGALYKAKPFIIECVRNENMQSSYRDIYSDRGLFTMIAEHDGITVTSLVTAISTDNLKALTLDAPSTLYDITQDSTHDKHYFEMFPSSAKALYTDVNLYTDPLLYPEYQSSNAMYVGGDDFEVLFDVAVRDTGVLYVRITGNTCPIKLYNICLNGVNYATQVTLNDSAEYLRIKDNGEAHYYNGSAYTTLPVFNFGGYKSHGNYFTCNIQYTDETTRQYGYVYGRVTSSGTDLSTGGN